MNEEEFRNELESVLQGIYERKPDFSDSNLPGGYIAWHTSKVTRNDDGSWNQQNAAAYIQLLQAHNVNGGIA